MVPGNSQGGQRITRAARTAAGGGGHVSNGGCTNREHDLDAIAVADTIVQRTFKISRGYSRFDLRMRWFRSSVANIGKLLISLSDSRGNVG